MCFLYQCPSIKPCYYYQSRELNIPKYTLPVSTFVFHLISFLSDYIWLCDFFPFAAVLFFYLFVGVKCYLRMHLMHLVRDLNAFIVICCSLLRDDNAGVCV